MDRFLRRFGSFLAISGIGWLMDFSIFFLLTRFGGFTVAGANLLSTVPAVTFVFFTATRKTFVCREGGLPMWGKYLLYVVYQAALVSAVSLLGQRLHDALLPPVTGWGASGGSPAAPVFALAARHFKLVVKLAITPVTMLMNYLVLGRIAERL